MYFIIQMKYCACLYFYAKPTKRYRVVYESYICIDNRWLKASTSSLILLLKNTYIIRMNQLLLSFFFKFILLYFVLKRTMSADYK